MFYIHYVLTLIYNELYTRLLKTHQPHNIKNGTFF